jgi:DNA-directed RNA polymerase subunit RPC12/RpoP
MPIYKCSSCSETFKQKGHYNYHRDNDACKERNIKCKRCGKGFTAATNMYRHMRKDICKSEEQINNDDKDAIFERLLKLEEDNKKCSKLERENAQLKKDMKKLETKLREGYGVINNNSNGTVNVNNGIINHNHITLIAYGQEDTSIIDKTELLKAFRSGFNSTLKLTETMHFNPEYPEYHNVYISSMKNKYAMMYDGREWTLVMKDDLIDKLYDDKRNYIEENFDEFIESLSNSQRNALYRWMDADDEHDYIKRIKNDIKLLLYNKRKIPMNNKNNILGYDETIDLDDLMDCDDMLDRKVIKSPKSGKNASRVRKLAGRPGTKRKNIVRRRS